MLIKLFSETNLLLKEIDFIPGLNFIIGKYSTDPRDARGVNGIGKSSLVRLISYCLLSDTAETFFNHSKYEFLRLENHNIILSIKIGERLYFIKRWFKNKSIYFGERQDELVEYTKSDLKKFLTNKFFPFENNEVFFEGNRFGSLMNFFIKDDLESQRRNDPLNFLPYQAAARETSIYNFFLLNLPTKSIIDYNSYLKEYGKSDSSIKALQERIVKDTGNDVSEYKSQMIKIQDKVNLLEKSLEDYKFLEQYKNIESQLTDLTAKINERLKDFYSYNNKLNKIRETYHFNESVDIDKVQRIYNEALQNFGDLVKKSLVDVQKFRKEILENRNKFLVSKERQLEKIVNEVLSEISLLEKERSDLYKRLDERGALESIKNTYEQLVIEKTSLETNMRSIRQINELEEELVDLDIKITETKRDLLGALKRYENDLNNLRGLFQEILKSAIFMGENYSEAYFDIKIKSKSKRDELPFKIEVTIPKAEALGQSRLKIVAYDLMVFLNNVQTRRVTPAFLVHDGVFHGMAQKTKINILNYIYHKYLENPTFQYITTFNEDEIIIPKDKENIYGKFEFDLSKTVIIEFSDTPSNMLFKRVLG